MPSNEPRLFPAVLKHWRGRRGLSQLDLSLAADVSARHVSFLETGRAQPSREMVLRLASALGVPLRDQNQLLQAAGFEAEHAEPGIEHGLSAAIDQAISRMLQQHEPYPMIVLDHRYDVLRTNLGAARLLARAVPDASLLPARINVFHLLFDPKLARSAVVDWERTARALLSRLHRESLSRAGDARLAALVQSLFAYPDVPESFRQPDFSVPSEPTMALRLRVDGLELAFLITVTVFNAPQNITVEELRIESYFPLDDATTRACEALVG